MSDNVLRVIPANPDLVPPQPAADQALLVLKALAPAADEITARLFAGVEFIDPGANMESVACPACATALDLGWWQLQMDAAYAGSGHGFGDLAGTVPCCCSRTSLNELGYDWPAGFARFALEARNPAQHWLDSSELRQLADVLGCPVRQIMAHY